MHCAKPAVNPGRTPGVGCSPLLSLPSNRVRAQVLLVGCSEPSQSPQPQGAEGSCPECRGDGSASPLGEEGVELGNMLPRSMS